MPSRPGSRIRLDDLLVERGLFATRDEAARACLAGEVTSPTQRIATPSQMVDRDCALNVKARPRFVSRGGEKLQGALDELGVDPTGLSCIDVGASSGGFTDCLLENGAASVVAVDVGYGQFAWRLRQDPRVSLFERTNIRKASAAELGGPFDLLVADLSFTSISSLLPALSGLVAGGGMFLLLVKPQFEIEKGEVGEGGVVRDASRHEKVLRSVAAQMPGHGIVPRAVCASVLRGPSGNFEFFVLAQKNKAGYSLVDPVDREGLEVMIVNAVERVHGKGGN